ncbi:Flp pilus assembly protein CpaB [Pseudomonas resinovorans]|uniref:Flp pilus assembly protein CpaB n=1 Tax=Metapseudomonas resinovorans TaxID=53412 RepID=UPI00237FCFEA|nr:Flp pilus assembly protein CpaB [Pseudomonas resinovorans]MDE3737425.1 Flp pilus assembly protein CpaB [Pseudomonas resinovorans]
MNSRMTMALAAVLLLGALLAGYWGIVLSRAPQTVESVSPVAPGTTSNQATDPADQLRTPVVVAARPLSPFVAVTAQDVRIEALRIAPPGSFSKIEEVIGRQPWTPVPAGSWLGPASFEAGGPLARMIRADERAMAVAVDDVVGGGGHLRPGDYVDVLLFLRGDSGDSQESAQVAVPALRLLSFGQNLGPDAEGRASQPAKEGEQVDRRPASTAVLAVPEQWVTRLMLASQAGSLRLAVRSADERLLERYQTGDLAVAPLDATRRSLIPLEQLSAGKAPRRSETKASAVSSASKGPGVAVYRGAELTRQNP